MLQLCFQQPVWTHLCCTFRLPACGSAWRSQCESHCMSCRALSLFVCHLVTVPPLCSFCINCMGENWSGILWYVFVLRKPKGSGSNQLPSSAAECDREDTACRQGHWACKQQLYIWYQWINDSKRGTDPHKWLRNSCLSAWSRHWSYLIYIWCWLSHAFSFLWCHQGVKWCTIFSLFAVHRCGVSVCMQ